MDKFVLQVPKWKGELVFSEDLLVFLGMILMLMVGVLFCFWGYKYFRTILLLGIGTVVCYFSFLLVAPMTTNLAVRMFLTVSLTFLGVCFVYFFDIIFCYLLDKLQIRNALGKRSYLLAAPLGAVILGLTIYHFIWRDEITVGVFSAVCLVTGLIFQHHKRKKMIRFRSYNDLIRLKRPKLDEDGLEIISVGMAGSAALAPVSSVLVTSEPEPEAAPVMEAKAEPVSEPEAAPVMEAKAEPVSGPETVPVMEAKAEPVSEPETVPVMEAEPEPVSEPEPVPVVAEPAPAPVPVFKPKLVLEPEFEPEPVFVANAKLQAISEIESEFAAGTEYGRGLQLVPDEIVEETVMPVEEQEEIVEETVTSAAEPAEVVEEAVTSVAELERIIEKIVMPVEEQEETVEEAVTPAAEPAEVIEEAVTSVAELERIIEKIVMPVEEQEETVEEAVTPAAEPAEVMEETVTPVAELEQIVKRIMASAAEPEPEPVPEASVKTKHEPVPEMSVKTKPEAQPVPVEMSDDIKNLILRKMETEEELLEEAFFVKQISKKMAGEKQLKVHPDKSTIAGKDRKSRRKREEGMAKGAVLAAAGLGAFIAGRISKGGD